MTRSSADASTSSRRRCRPTTAFALSTALRADGIGGELIDMALTHCDQKRDVRYVGYLLILARDWYAQRAERHT